MKTFYVAAALLMASTAAHAGNAISFQIDGHKIHIEAPKNCESLNCIKVTGADGLSGSGFNLKSLKSKLNGNNDDDDTADNSPATAPKAAPAPALQAPAPVANNPAPAPAPVATASTAPMPQLHDVTSSAPIAPAPIAAAPVQQPAPVTTASVADPTSPLGVWSTQDNKGNVRIEQCGPNLCGFGDKSNEKILINMKPSDNKWVGKIHDPDGGSTYNSTIAMKGSNILKVQGCAFGGLFCGGQTWKRVS